MRTFNLTSGELPFVRMAAGESVKIVLHCYDPDPALRGKLYDLTTKTVTITARPRCCGGDPQPTDPVLFSETAAVVGAPVNGVAALDLEVADTDGQEGVFALDAWAQDTVSGERVQLFPVGQLVVTTPATLPTS